MKLSQSQIGILKNLAGGRYLVRSGPYSLSAFLRLSTYSAPDDRMNRNSMPGDQFAGGRALKKLTAFGMIDETGITQAGREWLAANSASR